MPGVYIPPPPTIKGTHIKGSLAVVCVQGGTLNGRSEIIGIFFFLIHFFWVTPVIKGYPPVEISQFCLLGVPLM